MKAKDFVRLPRLGKMEAFFSIKIFGMLFSKIIKRKTPGDEETVEETALQVSRRGFELAAQTQR
jgi:hypothetical protein